LDCFDDMNYTKWMDKMVLLLTSLKNYYILDSNLSALFEPQEDESVVVVMTETWGRWSVLSSAYFEYSN